MAIGGRHMLSETIHIYFEEVSVVLGSEINAVREAIRRWKDAGMLPFLEEGAFPTRHHIINIVTRGATTKVGDLVYL